MIGHRVCLVGSVSPKAECWHHISTRSCVRVSVEWSSWSFAESRELWGAFLFWRVVSAILQ
jgi:hypothetical protein